MYSVDSMPCCVVWVVEMCCNRSQRVAESLRREGWTWWEMDLLNLLNCFLIVPDFFGYFDCKSTLISSNIGNFLIHRCCLRTTLQKRSFTFNFTPHSPATLQHNPDNLKNNPRAPIPLFSFQRERLGRPPKN